MAQNEEIKVINGEAFKNMCYGALNRLEDQQSYIDSLNVFPVPDGDTGTNMLLTFKEAVENLDKAKSERIDRLTQALSKGALMGARGNSGVILSQLLRGFSEANKNNRVMRNDDLINSLSKASKIAYQGVLKPVEGTILTVARKAARRAEKLEDEKNIEVFLEKVIETAHKALNKTPDQLPQLKEAGVVDAGGQGYLTILEGMKAGLTGKVEVREEVKEKREIKEEVAEELKYGYCTQTLINVKEQNVNIDEIKNDIEQFGDSLMVVGDDDIIKVHIHTNHPGIILEYALKTGSLRDIKIDNMRMQNAEMRKKHEEEQKEDFEQLKDESTEDYEEKLIKSAKSEQLDRKVGIIAVAKGKGIKNILMELGVDLIIDGGQSMNPSINDFVEAVEQMEQEKVIIFPNNKNIISAAQQASSLSDKEIKVVETKAIPEAIAALLVFNDNKELDELRSSMEEEISYVKTIEITNAVKDSKVNGFEINEDDVIGIVNGDIRAVGNSEIEVISDLIDEVWEDEDLITIYYGDGASQQDAEEIKKKFQAKSKEAEVEIYKGGQPLYPYIISME
ncbi:MAG TPA: DAK2 domain-containing protein [Halanaerobiales bacterium]|nr:DAK2 domain-containing protein [Halanaerobiales bacterium]